jgi:hypothetical protein
MTNFNQSGNNNRQVITGNFVGHNSGTVTQTTFGGQTTLSINGKTYTGSKIKQKDGRVFVDGKDVTDEVGLAQLVVLVQGNVEKLEIQGPGTITVTGNAGSVRGVSGKISVAGDVSGSVESISGDIKCGKVAGSVKTLSGDIKAR